MALPRGAKAQHILAALMKASGYSTKEVAYALKITPTTTSRWVKNGPTSELYQRGLERMYETGLESVDSQVRAIIERNKIKAIDRLVEGLDSSVEKYALASARDVLALGAIVPPTSGESGMKREPPRLVINVASAGGPNGAVGTRVEVTQEEGAPREAGPSPAGENSPISEEPTNEDQVRSAEAYWRSYFGGNGSDTNRVYDAGNGRDDEQGPRGDDEQAATHK